MLTRQQIDRFHARGFLNAGPVLDPDQVRVLRDEVLRTVEQRDDRAVKQPVTCRNVGRVEGEPLWQIVGYLGQQRTVSGVVVPSADHARPGTVDRCHGTSDLA